MLSIFIFILSGVTSYFNNEGKIKDFRDIQRSIQNVLIRLGMSPLLPKLEHAGPPEVLQVLLDGRVLGSIACNEVEKAVAHIRRLKLSATSMVWLLYLLHIHYFCLLSDSLQFYF